MIRFSNDRFVPLSRKGFFSSVDREDFEKIKSINWHLLDQGAYLYAHASIKGKPRMHRVIMNAPIGMEVDHIDGNGLNNRRANLRLATHAENQRNRRDSSGVTFCKWAGSKKWRAKIMYNLKHIHIGYFKTEGEAKMAYTFAAKKYFGEFANGER